MKLEGACKLKEKCVLSKARSQDQTMFNKFIFIFASCGLVIVVLCYLLYFFSSERASSIPESASLTTTVELSPHENMIKMEENIVEFDAWASLITENFFYNEVKKNIPENEDYIFLATVNTHGFSLEAILAHQDDVLNFSFWSSDHNEVIKCSSSVTELNVDIFDNKKFPNINTFGHGVHPYYTIVEKRKDSVVTVITYDSFFESLWKEVDKLKVHLRSKTPESCNPFNAKE